MSSTIFLANSQIRFSSANINRCQTSSVVQFHSNRIYGWSGIGVAILGHLQPMYIATLDVEILGTYIHWLGTYMYIYWLVGNLILGTYIYWFKWS